MEAFKKWRKQQEEDGIEVGFDYANEEGWRAAMEHMLTISENKCCFEDCIVHKAIKKELRKE